MKTPSRRPKTPPGAVDESAESEITIMPDGRVFAFGITRPLASLLATLPTADARTRRLLERLGRHDPGVTAAVESGTGEASR
jgi:hypothetical protein